MGLIRYIAYSVITAQLVETTADQKYLHILLSLQIKQDESGAAEGFVCIAV